MFRVVWWPWGLSAVGLGPMSPIVNPVPFPDCYSDLTLVLCSLARHGWRLNWGTGVGVWMPSFWGWSGPSFSTHVLSFTTRSLSLSLSFKQPVLWEGKRGKNKNVVLRWHGEKWSWLRRVLWVDTWRWSGLEASQIHRETISICWLSFLIEIILKVFISEVINDCHQVL